MPTVLDWFRIPVAELLPRVTGQSLLPLLQSDETSSPTLETSYASYNFHEIAMCYPMRVIYHKNYKLIHNINYQMPYPIASDLATSPTFEELLKLFPTNQTWPWFKSLTNYYYRAEWELYDLDTDPEELHNLWGAPSHAIILNKIRTMLVEWLEETADPWACSPGGLLLSHGTEKPHCLALHNDA